MSYEDSSLSGAKYPGSKNEPWDERCSKVGTNNTKVVEEFVMIIKKTRMIFDLLRLLLPLALILGACGAAGQVTSIDTSRSRLLIHVSKAGVFSGFGDNHEVEARIAKGSLDAKAGQLRLAVDSRQMRVLDPQLPSDKRREVQERMLGPDVLDSTHFPEIVFESTHVQQGEGKTLKVDGRLSLHGVTKPISIVVQVGNGRYTGRFTVKQRDFAITPVSIAGGTVKVKDELAIEFNILTGTGDQIRQ
jgi:polyisoprenoid-binding protein YceI